MNDAISLPSQPPPTSRSLRGLLPAWGWLLVAVVAFQTAVAAVVPVMPEEAYHWNFGRHLDWGYYDHPPMVPWAIALGRSLLGDTPLGVRIVPLLFALGTTLLLARLARRFYGDTAALWAVFLHALQPATLTIGSWGFPDSPLLFFWMLALTCVWNAVENRRPAWWLAAGAALGAGMLSKYTAAFLVPSLFLYLLWSRRDRYWLLTPWPYLAGVCALVVFMPVIYWNWTHEWVSFRMQSTGRLQAADGISWSCGQQATAEQWLFVIPLTLPLAVFAVWRLLRSPLPSDRFLLCAFAPMAAFFFTLGWTPSWHLLWSLPAYVTLTAAMAGAVATLPQRVPRFYRTRWRWVLGAYSWIMGALLLHVVCVLPKLPPLRETYAWEEVAERSRVVQASLPQGSFYLAVGRRSYPAASQLAFHLAEPFEVYGPNLIGREALQYRFWTHAEQLAGRDAVVVVEHGDPTGTVREELLMFFQTVEPAGEVTVPIGLLDFAPRRSLPFTLYVARGYQPVPSNAKR
jgi:dolichol-phosphate mannosyltransferase